MYSNENNAPIYAGIGARIAPGYILKIMTDCAIVLAQRGYICSTGACTGPDQAFGNGCEIASGYLNLHLPWWNYELNWIKSLKQAKVKIFDKRLSRAAFNSVRTYHPTYDKLSQGEIALHARNYNILNIPTQVRFIICWTEKGRIKGGTGQALRIAEDMGITVYNLGIIEIEKMFITKLNNEFKK